MLGSVIVTGTFVQDASCVYFWYGLLDPLNWAVVSALMILSSVLLRSIGFVGLLAVTKYLEYQDFGTVVDDIFFTLGFWTYSYSLIWVTFDGVSKKEELNKPLTQAFLGAVACWNVAWFESDYPPWAQALHGAGWFLTTVAVGLLFYMITFETYIESWRNMSMRFATIGTICNSIGIIWVMVDVADQKHYDDVIVEFSFGAVASIISTIIMNLGIITMAVALVSTPGLDMGYAEEANMYQKMDLDTDDGERYSARYSFGGGVGDPFDTSDTARL